MSIYSLTRGTVSSLTVDLTGWRPWTWLTQNYLKT